MRTKSILLLTGFMLVAAAGCGGGGSGDPGGGVMPPAGGSPSFAEVQAQIFDVSCAVSGCHVGAGAPFGFDLSSGVSYGNTVGVASAEIPTFNRVTPGNANDSYLYMKVVDDPRIMGDPMPFGNPLDQARIDLLRQWIEEGANP